MCHWYYPAHQICKHPDRRLKRKYNSHLEGWQQHSRIDKCILCWGNQKEPCGRNPDRRDGDEDQKWIAEPCRGLGDFCPSCDNTYRTSGETLLSVPMIFVEFDCLIRDWCFRDYKDITDDNIREMHADQFSARAQYNQDTLQGPWNNAEANLREAFSEYQRKWEASIGLAKQARREQELDQEWRDTIAYVNPALQNQIEGAIEEEMPGLPPGANSPYFRNSEERNAHYGIDAGSSSLSTQARPTTSAGSGKHKKKKRKSWSFW